MKEKKTFNKLTKNRITDDEITGVKNDLKNE